MWLSVGDHHSFHINDIGLLTTLYGVFIIRGGFFPAYRITYVVKPGERRIPTILLTAYTFNLPGNISMYMMALGVKTTSVVFIGIQSAFD